jgi:hypothetical protein
MGNNRKDIMSADGKVITSFDSRPSNAEITGTFDKFQNLTQLEVDFLACVVDICLGTGVHWNDAARELARLLSLSSSLEEAQEKMRYFSKVAYQMSV